MALEAGNPNPNLQAGGTLPRDRGLTHPGIPRRIRLLIELGLIFVAAPLLVRVAIFRWHIPLPLVLQPVLLGVIAYLLWDRTFRMGSELTRRFSRDTLLSIVLIFVLVAAAMTLYVHQAMPVHFLDLPTRAPRLWLVLMFAYPLVSVIPQELIYRTLFFHRYGPLFGNARWLAYLVNGLLFGFAHVIFGSYVSIVLTTVLGCLVAWRYDVTRSFWAVWLEHSLYGCFVFTIGLGHYFFTGIATL